MNARRTRKNSGSVRIAREPKRQSGVVRGANHTAVSGKASEADNWDARLGFLMHDVSRLRRSVFDEYMKRTGVTRSQWWVLAHLSRQDGMIQSDLADVLELGKAALGGLIDRLESSGQIERRSDHTDRRVKRVYLSSKGSQMVKHMTRSSHEMSERILDGLDLGARQALVDMLGLVKRNLLKIRSDAEVFDDQDDHER